MSCEDILGQVFIVHKVYTILSYHNSEIFHIYARNEQKIGEEILIVHKIEAKKDHIFCWIDMKALALQNSYIIYVKFMFGDQTPITWDKTSI